MADGYLPPVVVRLVAETAEAVAALEQFGAAVATLGERATAVGREVDTAFTGMGVAAYDVEKAAIDTGAAFDRMATQATAANERAAASTRAVVDAEAQAAAAADKAAASQAAGADKVVASKEREAAAARTEADAEAKSAELAAIAAEKRQIAIDKQIAAYEKMNYANDIEVRNAQAAAAKTGAAWEAESAKVEASQARVGAAMEGTSAKSAGMGAAASRSLGMIGLAAGGVAVETVKMASTFDQKMMLIHTMAGVPLPVMEDMKQKVLALGAATGQGPDKLAEGLYHLVSSGIPADQAINALGATAKGATMGMSDLDTTAYALAGVMSAGMPDIHNYDEAIQFMNTAVGQGDMKMQDLANSIKSGILPVMKNAGLSMTDFTASVATLADNSMPAEMAMNRLRTGVMMLQNQSKPAIAAMKDLGIQEGQLANDMKTGGMQQVIEDLKSHMENYTKSVHGVAMALPEIQKASGDYHDQLIKDGATEEEAKAATDKYAQALRDGGSASMQAANDLAKGLGGARTASTFITLIDESAKFEQKLHALGDTASRAKDFNDHWNDTLQNTQVKFEQAKAGAQALGIQIGENLSPAVNVALDAVAKFGAAITSGNGAAKIAADVIGGVLVAVIAAYTAKMVVAVAQTVAWAATGVASFMVGVARMVAGWGLLGTSAQEWAVTSRAAAAEAEAANTTATEGVVAAWRTAMLEVIATIRGAGPEMAAAAATDGEEAGAAMSTGMEGGLAAGKAKVAAAGAESAGAAGVASKAGFLSKFAKSAGEVGLVLMGVEAVANVAGVPGPLEMVQNLMGEINNYMTGDPLTPSQNAWEMQFRRMSNTVREQFGLADLFTKDGGAKIGADSQAAAVDAATKWQQGTAPIPGNAQQTTDNVGAIFNNLQNKVVPPTAGAVDAVGNQLNRLPDIARPPFDALYDNSHNSLIKLAADGDVQGQAIEHAIAQHLINGSTTATGAVADMKDKVQRDEDGLHAHTDATFSAINQSAGNYFAQFARTVDDKTAQARSSAQDNMDKAQAHIATGGQKMDQDAQVWADKFGKTVTNGGQAARDGMNKAQDDMRAHTQTSMSQQTTLVADGMTGQLRAMSIGQQQMIDTTQRNMDAVRSRSGDGLAGLNRDADTYWKLYPKPVPPAMEEARKATETGVNNANKEVGKMPGEFAKSLQPLPGQMKTSGGDSIDGFKQGFDDKSPGVLQGIKDWFSNQIREAKAILGIASPSTVFNSIGVDMMTGLWNGLVSMMNDITTKVQNWINNTVAAIRATLGMHSPSRVMHEIGHHFMQGFHNGMMGQHQHNVDAARRCAQDVVNCYQQVLQDAHAPGWSQMQGWIDPNFDQETLIHQQTQQMNQHQGGHRNRWGCWVCGEDNHKPIECPNTNQVLTLTRRNSGIGVQDSTVQAGVTNNITVQGAVLDHQGMFQALQEAALRSGQRNSFTGGFGSPR